MALLNQWAMRLASIAAASLEWCCIQTLSRLPMTRAIRVKECRQVTGRLDYSGADILMVLDSTAQLSRLHACKKEPETVEWLRTHIQPGDVLYDIGANVGAYSFVAYSLAGGDCTVYAFEPSFSTFSALSQNVLLNGCCGGVVPLHVALSDRTDLLMFEYSSVSPGAALHGLRSSDGDVHGTVAFVVFRQPILSYRLDDLVRQFNLRPPTHIKLDVDGAELSVLRGANQTLGHPSLRSMLIEIDEELYPVAEIHDLLAGKGFCLRSRHRRGQSDKLHNCIFEREGTW